MKHYLIAQLKIVDEAWIPDYAANVLDLIHRHGGRYLARSANIQILEGNPPAVDLVAILEFPNMNALRAFMADPDYAPYAESRRAGTESHFTALDSTDAVGTIPYLESGAA